MNITDIKRRLSKIEGGPDSGEVVQMLKHTQVTLKGIESKQLEQQSLVVDDLNNTMRRYNFIFKEIPEQSSESWKDTEDLVTDFVSKNLGLATGEIERAHRIGVQKPDYPRPIIVKFLNFKGKSNILKYVSKLKELKSPRVWIEEDFSSRMQLIRKKIRDFARTERKPGDKFKLVFDKLVLNNTIYALDHTTSMVTALPKRHAPTQTQ